MPKLTIGMAHYDDYHGLWMTVQALRIFHAEVMDQVEILVVDNRPNSAHGKMAQKFITGWASKNPGGARWIPAEEATGTSQPRNRVFAEAAGDAVVCMDCHVLIEPGAIKKLLHYYATHPGTRDLLSGPLVYDDLGNISTHFDDVWRAEMWGIWATDERGKDPAAEPFEVPGQGLGLFSCRKEAWLGFHPGFRGFGGEEMYIHAKYRAAGAKCLCLPFLRWNHRFGRPEGVRYPLTRQNKVRNYLIGHLELGMPLDRVHEHFVEGKLTPQEEWDKLVAEATDILADPSKAAGGCESCEEKKAKRLQTLYDAAANNPSDINEHCPKLKELASQCEHVTEFGVRHGVSTVALLAGQPKHLVSYDVNADPVIQQLATVRGKTDFRFEQADVLEADIQATDMLFIDTRHHRAQLLAELTRHAGKVRRWIVLHDTQIYGEHGDDGSPGVLVGLREWMTSHPEWSVLYHTQANNGLTVIGCDPRDKPKLPGTLQMAGNFAKALAAHVADGLDKVGSETLVDRLSVCTLCDQRTDDRCAVCGCYIAEKASWASSECPLGKWVTTTGGRGSMTPLVSCICPTYGRAPKWLHLVEEAVESFLRQDWPAKELIVLNDAPCQTLVCDAPGVRVVNETFRYDTLGGKYNAAIEYSRGDLICPWEDDDISLPWRIRASVVALGAAEYYNPYAEWFLDRRGLHDGNGVCHHSSIFRRTAWERVGGYPLLSGPQDAVMNGTLHRDCVTSNSPPPCHADRWYIYRWGVSPVHLSGSGTHQQFWDAVGKQELQPGTYKLHPHWVKDYVMMCREKLAQEEAAYGTDG